MKNSYRCYQNEKCLDFYDPKSRNVVPLQLPKMLSLDNWASVLVDDTTLQVIWKPRQMLEMFSNTRLVRQTNSQAVPSA